MEAAKKWLLAKLKKAPTGTRTLRWLGGEITEDYARTECVFTCFVGNWIEVNGEWDESKMPYGYEPTVDRGWMVIEKTDGERIMGEWEDDEFRNGNVILRTQKVARYLILPPTPED